MLNHGGHLISAAKRFNIPVEDWVDLSTGINPNHYPIPGIPVECFARLPEEDDGLIEAARHYYQADNILPVSGSQTAIQILPEIRKKSKVAVPEIGYAEHAFQWKKSGHVVIFYSSANIEHIIHEIDVLVVINPNNPTGEFYSREQLLNWHQILLDRNGWLIVDEAFIDSENISSLVGDSEQPGLIVLRSVGKYFGLAGLRAGFVFAEENMLNILKEKTGPWSITGVSRYVVKMALTDTKWQMQNEIAISETSDIMEMLIYDFTGVKPSGTNLFKTVFHDEAVVIYRQFAEQGILVRLLDNHKAIRFGMPSKHQIKKVKEVFQRVFSDCSELGVLDKKASA